MSDSRRCRACDEPSAQPTCGRCTAGSDPLLVRPYVDRAATVAGPPKPVDSMTTTWEFPAAAVPALDPAPPGHPRPVAGDGSGAGPGNTPGTATGGLAGRIRGRMTRLRTRDRMVLIGAALVLVVAAPVALARGGGQDAPEHGPTIDAGPVWVPPTTADLPTGEPSALPDPARTAGPRATSSAIAATPPGRSAAPGPSATAGSAGPTTPAPATPSVPFTAPRTGRIIGTSGLCVDNMYDNRDHGNPITMASCNGSGAQRWTFREDGSLQMHRMCMGPAGHGASSPVQLRRCGRGSRPAWQFRSDGTILHVASRLCLHDRGGTGGPTAPNGAPQLSITSCSGAPGQRWTFR
ncbi:ricin-type beta-trefoil lectin domain protein [Polymorphospora sp. A560]|uniref:ricin-type beta-trefoil lectin domain protein n=1 Tax=Polymorphospora sp. A560 TaxID=3040203 RepID=UPI003891F106